MHIHSILSITPLELKFVNISTIEHFREYPYSFLLAFLVLVELRKNFVALIKLLNIKIYTILIQVKKRERHLISNIDLIYSYFSLKRSKHKDFLPCDI